MDRLNHLWEATCAERVHAPALDEDAHADLVIVGGGFTGCAAALEAASDGAKVRLLEARTIGHGGSGRNVGLVNAGLWLAPEAVAIALGRTEGERLLEILGAGPERVFSLIARHSIDCEATRRGTLHCAHSAQGLADLRERQRQLRDRGAPVELLTAQETERRTGSARFHGALFDPRAGTIQPLAYCRGLARAAADAGARLHSASPVLTVEREGEAWRVRTARGTVTAAALLVASNAYHVAPEGGPVPQFVAMHYFQLATKPLDAAARGRILAGGEGCWDTAMVMSSFRLDRAGRLIVGAIGDLGGPGGPLHRNWARRKVRRLFPWLGERRFTHEICGRIAVTGDHVPKIVEFGRNAFAVFGYSGRGIAPGTTFGMLAASALLHGDAGRLPIAPVPAHRERFRSARQAWYEFGATLAHAVA